MPNGNSPLELDSETNLKPCCSCSISEQSPSGLRAKIYPMLDLSRSSENVAFLHSKSLVSASEAGALACQSRVGWHKTCCTFITLLPQRKAATESSLLDS